MSLNPHQFGDQGTLFDAPLGQPDNGIFRGHPQARLYRSITVPEHHVSDLSGLPGYLAREGKDAGVSRRIGIHWQHDLSFAHQWSDSLSGEDGRSPVIVEADHPGHENVMYDNEMSIMNHQQLSDHIRRNSVGHRDADGNVRSGPTAPGSDAHTLYKTVFAAGGIDATDVEPEVPVRPGTDLSIHAIHVPDAYAPSGYRRIPMQFRGQA